MWREREGGRKGGETEAWTGSAVDGGRKAGERVRAKMQRERSSLPFFSLSGLALALEEELIEWSGKAAPLHFVCSSEVLQITQRTHG